MKARGRSYCKVEVEEQFPQKLWFSRISGMDRTNLRNITRMRTGHGIDPAHLCKLDIRENALCECVEAWGIVVH